MAIRFLIYFMTFSMFLGAPALFAPIYKIDEWVKDSAQGEQQAFCFSDMHCDFGNQKITSKQQEDIRDAAKARNAFVIVEDMDVVDDGSGILQQKHNAHNLWDKACLKDFKQDFPHSIIEVSPLRGLVRVCNTSGLSCANVEFRQYLYNQHDMEPFKLSVKSDERYGAVIQKNKSLVDHHDVMVTFADVAAGLQKIEKEIAGYMDQGLKDYYAAIETDKRAPLINDAIKETLTWKSTYSHENFMEIIRAAVKKVIGVKEEELKTTAAGRMIHGGQCTDAAVVRYQGFFDTWLEARILHRIAQSKSRVMFVCAGGVHIEAIAPQLVALGWRLKETKGAKLQYESEEDIRHIIENQSIDIADYFNRKQAQATPVLVQPKRFSYWHIVCASAVAATLGYLGYRYFYNRLFVY